MTIKIPNTSVKQAALIETALKDDEFRALAITVGALLPFSRPMQQAILNLVQTKLSEDND